jgi:uncharacterized protein
MKLQPDKFDVPTITGYGPGWVGLDGEKIYSSVVVGSRGERFEWPCQNIAHLGQEHLAPLVAAKPELVVLGSGSKLRFAHPSHAAALAAHGIGLETMDTAAACRTFNILAGEGRHVLAALLIEPSPSPAPQEQSSQV